MKKIFMEKILLLLVGAFITTLAFSADEPTPSGHGGGGSMSGSHCFQVESKTVTEVCADFQVGWKLWILMGEPIGDYRLKWKLTSLKLRKRNDWISMAGLQYNNVPPYLAKEAQSIEIYLDAVANVWVGSLTLGTGGISRIDGKTMIVKHAFNTGVGTRAGRLSVNTPGSPKWSEFFKDGDYGGYLSEKDAKAIFKASDQPNNPIKLSDLQIGPNSTVSGLGDIEGKIAELCGNEKTAPNYDFCPEIKKNPKEEKEPKKKQVDDPFAAIDKGGASKDPFAGLEKGKASQTGKSSHSAFDDVESHLAEVEKQRAIQRAAEARHDEAVRFCTSAFESKRSCIGNAGCGTEPEKTICTDSRARSCPVRDEAYFCITIYDCISHGPNPKHSEWEACTSSADISCAQYTSASSMDECVTEREKSGRAK